MVLGLTWLATTRDNVKRLLVEAKFYAALLQDQASGYAQQFDEPGPTVLLFICPESQNPDVVGSDKASKSEKQMGIGNHRLVLRVCRRARLTRYRSTVGACQLGPAAQKGWMIWLADAISLRSDIRQLRGLAQSTRRSRPFLADSLRRTEPWPARIVKFGYKQLVDDVIDARRSSRTVG